MCIFFKDQTLVNTKHSKFLSKQSRFVKKKHTFDTNKRNDKTHLGGKITAGNVETDITRVSETCTDDVIQGFICHQHGDHDSTCCPNGKAKLYMNNNKHKEFKLQNMQKDAAEPPNRLRVCIVEIFTPVEENGTLQYRFRWSVLCPL